MTKIRSSPSLAAPSTRKMERRTPVHQPSFNSAPGTLHCAGLPWWAASFLCVFLAAATCPGRERALGHGEQGGPQGCPTPANSHERSAQTNPGLGRTLVRIGRKTPGEVIRAPHVCWAASPRGLEGNCECPHPVAAKRHSLRRNAARTMPVDPRPAGVPSLALYHGARPITKSGLQRSPASPTFCFQGPLPHGLHIGNP